VSYLSTILADAPLHFWRCADGGGQIAHDIGSSRVHLITTIQPLLGYSGPNSDGGSCLMPTGADLNSAGGNLATVVSPFSMELWFWAFALLPTQRYLMAWDGSTPNAAQIFINTNGAIQPQVSGTFPTPSTVPTIQHWHHAVLTYDGVTIRSYLDAIAQPTIAKAGPITITRPIGIGAEPSVASLAFEGFISEAALYGATLSAGQISTHFAAANTPSQTPVYTAVIGAGGAGGVTGGVAPSGLDDILNSVRKTY
jgi:hypothetical protein